jgi:hypothetical protein
MQKKAMDTIVVEKIKEDRWKKREEKRLNRVADVRFIVAIQKVVEKWAKTQFSTTWILTIVEEVGNKFHQKFYTGMRANLYKYIIMNFRCGIINVTFDRKQRVTKQHKTPNQQGYYLHMNE